MDLTSAINGLMASLEKSKGYNIPSLNIFKYNSISVKW